MTLRKKIIAFIEAYCKIPEGVQVVQPMKLMKFQRQVIFWRSMTTCMASAMLISALLKMIRLSPYLSKIVRLVPSQKILIGLVRNVE